MFPAILSTATPVQKPGVIAPAQLGVEVTDLLRRNPTFQCLVQYVAGTTPGQGGSYTLTYFSNTLNGDTVTVLLALATVPESGNVPGA